MRAPASIMKNVFGHSRELSGNISWGTVQAQVKSAVTSIAQVGAGCRSTPHSSGALPDYLSKMPKILDPRRIAWVVSGWDLEL